MFDKSMSEQAPKKIDPWYDPEYYMESLRGMHVSGGHLNEAEGDKLYLELRNKLGPLEGFAQDGDLKFTPTEWQAYRKLLKDKLQDAGITDRFNAATDMVQLLARMDVLFHLPPQNPDQE